MAMQDAQEQEASRSRVSSEKGPCHPAGIACVSYGAVVVVNQGWKCVPGSKAKPLPRSVVKIHPLIRSVDVLSSIGSVLASGLSDGICTHRPMVL